MNDIKGFLTIPSLVDNRDGFTAKFGEISELAETFSRDRRLFAKASTAPNVTLTTFRYVDGTGVSVNPGADAVVSRILVLGQWIYNQYDAGQIPSQLQNASFAEAIAQEHNFTEVTVGVIEQGATSSKRLPTYVRFRLTDAGVDYTIKIWLSDTAFKREYEHYQSYVIPPLPNLSDLRLGLVGLTNVMSSIDLMGHVVDNLTSITSKYPQTAVIKFPVEWHDLSNPDVKTTVTWSIITYGSAGTDQDAVKEAIRNYIASNSNEAQWNVIFPSLYSENEFVIVPVWDSIAAPESGPLPILFSPTITVAKIQSVSTTKLPAGYGQVSGSISNHIRNNLRALPSNYRELSLLVVGNPNNSGGIMDIKQLYPDYTGIASTSADFSRMTESTRNFIIQLQRALDIAYSADLNTVMPSGFIRTTRSSRLYVSFAMGGYQFMVQTRSAYNLA